MAAYQAPKSNNMTVKTLTIDELSVLHETLQIGNYTEPTNEQHPPRPRLSKPITREMLIRRLNAAYNSSKLGEMAS